MPESIILASADNTKLPLSHVKAHYRGVRKSIRRQQNTLYMPSCQLPLQRLRASPQTPPAASFYASLKLTMMRQIILVPQPFHDLSRLSPLVSTMTAGRDFADLSTAGTCRRPRPEPRGDRPLYKPTIFLRGYYRRRHDTSPPAVRMAAEKCAHQRLVRPFFEVNTYMFLATNACTLFIPRAKKKLFPKLH